MPAARSPARLPPMQVRDVLAQARNEVAEVRGARAVGGEAFLERCNLVEEMGQRAAGVGLKRFRFVVACSGCVGFRRVRTERITTVCEKAIALCLGPCARQPCPQIPALGRL